MKRILPLLAVSAFLVPSICLADIHLPPASEQGPTRKLGRGISNVLFAITELPQSVNTVNDELGNAAAGGYGITRGVARTLARTCYGIFDIVTFPFPTYKGSYRPPYRNSDIWLERGFTEFAPELGWESRKPYCE